jgi:hypothetical protein
MSRRHRAMAILRALLLLAALVLTSSGSDVASNSTSSITGNSNENVTSIPEYPIRRYEFKVVSPTGPINETLRFENYRRMNPHGKDARWNGGIKQPVYVSITTIKDRIDKVHEVIYDVLNGAMMPTKIYLFISEEPYLLDDGIHPEKDLPLALTNLTSLYPVTVVSTNNIGPHRKLLPLLSEKWNEDCVIITMDDESKSHHSMSKYVEQLLKYYIASDRDSVIGLKVRRMAMCDQFPWKYQAYHHWGVTLGYRHKEMFALPTGTGGVLYRPRFFHPVVFSEELRLLTHTADDIMFRVAAMAQRTPVVFGCRDSYYTHEGETHVHACPDTVDHIVSKTHTEQLLTTWSPSYQDQRRLVPNQLSDMYNNINGGRKNDEAFVGAIKYITARHLIDWGKLAETYIREERRTCADQPPETRDSACMMFRCS